MKDGVDWQVLHLLSGEDEPLLWRRDALLLLHSLLDPLHLVCRLDVNLNLDEEDDVMH